MTSALFAHVERLHGDRPWGDVLDAGTGVNSSQWSRALPARSWTGVSASAGHLAQVRDRLGPALGDTGRLIQGDWTDPALLAGETFDVVLADYLLGAVEGFSPYFQSGLFARLAPLVRSRLYVVGLDPYVVGPVTTEADRIVRDIGRLRDAVLLMSGETPYREYPAEWVLETLARSGLRVLGARRFPNRYHHRWINGQLGMALRRLPRLEDPAAAEALAARIERLRLEAIALCEAQGGLRSGCDYVIVAEPVA